MKINGVDVSEINELTENIKKYYGSLNSFSNVTGFSYGKLKNALLNLEFKQETIDEIRSKYEKHLDKENIPFRISEQDIVKIRVCIYTHFSKVRHFCQKHPDYTEVFMSNLLNNKCKLRSTRYVSLTLLLQKKYGLELEN